MKLKVIGFAVMIALAGGLSGCFKKGDTVAAVDEDQKKADALLGQQGKQTLADLASATPKNYTFPGQVQLPTQVLWVNGSVGSEATLSHEGDQDEGGTDYGGIVQTTDVTSYVPAGQPVEILIQLQWNAKEMNSVDYDIYVDVPGNTTSHYPAKSEDMNWNVPTKTLTVGTIGVAGANHLIGVQATSGKTAEAVPYTMRIEFTYAKDVVTPGIPWAFDVPSNATGIILESVKAGGDEHVKSQFIVIGPDDNLVAFVDFNDLAIPTESVFIPVTGGGEYVFWAYYMQGGFLSVRADVPLDNLQARPLGLVATDTVVASTPAPGIIARDWGFDSAIGAGTAVTPMTGQQEATFSLEGPHPLGVRGFIRGPATAMAQITITSSKGVVNDMQRVARYDDERGSIGLTADEGFDNQVHNANIVKGAYTVQVVNDGPSEVGYTVLTYTR